MNTRLDAGALQQKLPPRRQTLRAGVRRPVRVVRDGGWVPHIYAETAWDLFLGPGFAMAQDRLWQMDYLRRRALGLSPRCWGERPSPPIAADEPLAVRR